MSVAQNKFGRDGRVKRARAPPGCADTPWPEVIGIRGRAYATLQLKALEPAQGHTLPSALTADVALLGHPFSIFIEFFAGIELTKEVSEIVDRTVTLA